LFSVRAILYPLVPPFFALGALFFFARFGLLGFLFPIGVFGLVYWRYGKDHSGEKPGRGVSVKDREKALEEYVGQVRKRELE